MKTKKTKERTKRMKIKDGTVVICDYLLPRSSLGIVRGVSIYNCKTSFLIEIIWPEVKVLELKRRAFTPICNEPDDLRKIVHFIKPSDLPFNLPPKKADEA